MINEPQLGYCVHFEAYTCTVSPELKTEERYSADNVGTMSAQHLTKDICLTRKMLCGHSEDIVPTLCGHISPGIYVRTN